MDFGVPISCLSLFIFAIAVMNLVAVCGRGSGLLGYLVPSAVAVACVGVVAFILKTCGDELPVQVTMPGVDSPSARNPLLPSLQGRRVLPDGGVSLPIVPFVQTFPQRKTPSVATVVVSTEPMLSGTTVDVQIFHKWPAAVSRVRLSLVCIEPLRVNTSQWLVSGDTTVTRQILAEEAVRVDSQDQPIVHTSIRVPGNVMHSLRLGSPAIQWCLKVETEDQHGRLESELFGVRITAGNS